MKYKTKNGHGPISTSRSPRELGVCGTDSSAKLENCDSFCSRIIFASAINSMWPLWFSAARPSSIDDSRLRMVKRLNQRCEASERTAWLTRPPSGGRQAAIRPVTGSTMMVMSQMRIAPADWLAQIRLKFGVQVGSK